MTEMSKCAPRIPEIVQAMNKVIEKEMNWLLDYLYIPA